jgi:hypothetical protein
VHFKRSTKALINKGDLVRSIGTRPAGRKAWFVGIHRTAKNREGRALYNIAALHEQGGVIFQTVTKRQEKFFQALYYKGLMPGPVRLLPRAGKRIKIVIKARPFVKPVFEKLSPGSKDRILRDVLVGTRLAGGM